MNNVEKLIGLEHVNFRYTDKERYILKDVSFSVFSGQKISIIGLNGAGKSTLLKILAGLEQVTSGQIVRKKDVSIEYISQNFHFDPTYPITCLEFLRLFYPKNDIQDFLSFFQIFDFEEVLLYQNMHNLSGGQKQKLMIIRALISKPDLLLLDEPTSGIDLIAEEKFYENISLLHKKFPKITSIIISHHLHFVYRYSDKVLFLHENTLCCEDYLSEKHKDIYNSDVLGKYILPYMHKH